MSVCKNCKFYNACGSNKRKELCNGYELKLDIQKFGGRGATSGETLKLTNKAKSIIKEWGSSQKATTESEQQFRNEINKMNYDKILKLAERLDETDISRLSTNDAFAVNIAFQNVIKVGRTKNANKWSTDFGKWRK